MLRIEPPNAKGFTLLELMVAVVVLLAIMVAVGRIFSTTSDISASGQAISETLQQGVAVEQQLRNDIAHLSHEGFFAIRSVAVANDLKGEFMLIDDSLPSDALIRCDQLIFFRNGVASAMTLPNALEVGAGGTDFAGQGLASMVYYGHGVRFPQLPGQGEDDNSLFESDDPILINNETGIVTPWYEGIIEAQTRQYPNGNAQRFDVVLNSDYDANGTQQHPAEWTLCRQLIVLGDDDDNAPGDDSKKSYLSRGISSQTIFPWDPRIGGSNFYPHVLHGRVDIAATHLDDIRQSVLQEVELSSAANRIWREDADNIDQQELIASLFYWPRVEPYPPTSIRYDQALMMHALVEGCVSFKIEWTFDEGVGEAIDSEYNWFPGYSYGPAFPQPWFGESWATDSDGIGNQYSINFDTLTRWTSDANNDQNPRTVPAWSVDPTIIEPYFNNGEGPPVAPVPTLLGVDSRISEYWAIFGYNGQDPFFENDLDFLNDAIPDDGDLAEGGTDDGSLPGSPTWRYTPWPSAIRIAMRILDRDNRLGSGWTYQFVVDLPERKQ